MKTYNLGDKVWYAQRKSTQEVVTCPECFGKKYLTVILGDDSKVTIDCAACAAGYESPKGYVTYYKQDISVRLVTICKIDITSEGIEYGFDKFGSGMRIGKGTDFFATAAEAEVRAKELAEEWNKEQLAKINRKEKNNRTWSWHVHYHRRQIRECKKTIEYATKQLDAAKTHIKKEDNHGTT